MTNESHAPERPATTTSGDAEHGARVAGMFGRIARFYDFLNHFLSLGLDILWRRELVRHLRLGRHDPAPVLDLAAGTLDVSLEIGRKHPGRAILAADFALPMLRKGQQKLLAAKAGNIQPVLADGRFLPMADASVAAASIAFGIRNIRPRQAAYAEILRVLKPGGRFCILEFGTGRRKIWGGAYNFYLNTILPGCGRLISGDAGAYRYLADTIRAFPAEDELVGELTRAGFGEVYYKPMASGIVYLHVGVKPQERAANDTPDSRGARA